MKVADVIANVNSEKYWSLFDFEANFDLTCVAININIDRYRWYELSTNVYKCDDGYVGVTGIAKCFDEYASPVDMDCPCYAEEFVPIETVQYISAYKANKYAYKTNK